jgi:seryl-tRNA synthetase
VTNQANLDQLDEAGIIRLGEKLGSLYHRLERLKNEKREAAKDLNDQIKAAEKDLEDTATEYDRQVAGYRALVRRSV